uniref:Myotubularin phosphatase domain-containing protein n=1 Tax=Gongylonema pulchrum TaxID=637853 RepID=A0A183ER95_9BILA
LILAWRIFVPDECGKKKNNDDRDSSRKIGGSATVVAETASSAGAPTVSAMDSSSIESLRALLVTDAMPDDRNSRGTQQFAPTLQPIPQCSASTSVDDFLRYCSGNHNTERYLLAIPELEVSEMA